MSSALYPLLFEPVYKDYIWGGDRIIRKYNRGQPPGIYAESWEVSDRDDGMSVICNGMLKGRSLKDAIAQWGSGLMGTRVASGRFPLLIKLIDSRERLSVQVHPDDRSAAQWGGEAKTESWYVLDTDPGAGVFAGLKPGVGAAEFQQAIKEARFKELLSWVPVSPGDAIFIPGGLVHAIDEGCLLLEVQQNSNTTYRIYDWDRVGADGKPRPLHIQEALKVINWDLGDRAKAQAVRLAGPGANEQWLVVESPYFRLERVKLEHNQMVEGLGETFHVLFVSEGEVRIQWDGGSELLVPGTSCLVPAALSNVELMPQNKLAEVLTISLPGAV
jgi:mannose-6-phosphate isomerase